MLKPLSYIKISKNLEGTSFWCISVAKKVSIDSEKVIMHIYT
jgi:hypothetical protein